MLHPLDYARINVALFGKVNDLDTLITKNPDDSLGKSWNDLNTPSEKKKIKNCMPPISVDLVQSVAIQIKFWPKLLALGDEHMFCSDKFLNEAVVDYRKFLFLKKTAGLGPGAYLIPSMFVDLIWHSHMLYPVQYAADTVELAGVVLDHIDRPLPDMILTKHWKDTINAWEEQYGEILVTHSATAYLADKTTTNWHKQLTEHITNANPTTKSNSSGASACVGGGA